MHMCLNLLAHWVPTVVTPPPPPGGGVLPEKLGVSVRTASQNPYPIYDQNLRYSLPYSWLDQKFETLFMTWLLNQKIENPVSDQRYNKFPSSKFVNGFGWFSFR